ncbi:hypothetical protein NBRC10513_005516 [Rhodotorula toruloides]
MSRTTSADHLAPRSLPRLAILCALIFLSAFLPAAAAQDSSDTTVYTTYTDNGSIETCGQVVTTSVPATVYTTENQVFTWQPTTPPTPTPSIVSRGSVLNVQDFLRVDEEEFRKDWSERRWRQ